MFDVETMHVTTSTNQHTYSAKLPLRRRNLCNAFALTLDFYT
jgi:hypothetical protein